MVQNMGGIFQELFGLIGFWGTCDYIRTPIFARPMRLSDDDDLPEHIVMAA